LFEEESHEKIEPDARRSTVISPTRAFPGKETHTKTSSQIIVGANDTNGRVAFVGLDNNYVFDISQTHFRAHKIC
jgi:hypothetical protein